MHSILRKYEFYLAEIRLKQRIEKDSFFLDLRAGLVILYADLPIDTMTVIEGNYLLSQSPHYKFIRDERVNWKLIHLLMARSLVRLSEFEDALFEVQKILPDFYVDVSTPSGRSFLLEKIKELLSNI